MKNYLLLAIIFCLFSCNEKHNSVMAPKAENSTSQRQEFDCDTTRYTREWITDDKTYSFISLTCFPVPANDSTCLIGWDPKSIRLTKMNREWVFPAQTGNSGKVLSTNGTSVSWVTPSGTYTAGSGLNLIGSVFSNTAPDQTVSISAGDNTTITGTYPNFTVGQTKKSIPLIGTTNASGDYTYTYPVAYSTIPCVTATLVSNNDLDGWRITSSTTTGFTVHAFRQNTNTLLGIINLVSTTTNLNGATINVLVTEN